MTASMDLVSILGRMVDNTRATGTMASSTATVSTAKQVVKRDVDAGKKASAAIGMMSSSSKRAQPQWTNNCIKTYEQKLLTMTKNLENGEELNYQHIQTR